MRAKKLTNIRAVNEDENTLLSPPREIEIEWTLEWMEDDELLEGGASEPERSRAEAIRARLRRGPRRMHSVNYGPAAGVSVRVTDSAARGVLR